MTEPRVALVTGGASGIGRASAQALAADGCAVVVCDMSGDVTAVADEITSDGGSAVGAVADVRSAAQLRDAVGTAVSTFGGLDVLVTAAAVQIYGTATTTTQRELEDVLAVNVTGVFLACQAALPELRNRPGAAIVMISSVQAHIAQTKVVAYSTSKGAVNAMARAIAMDEIAHGVRVNTVCPGSVDTPLLRRSARQLSDGTDEAVDELVAQWGRAHPIGRVASPDEVASVVSFLASDQARFMTGEDVRVDGGLLATVGVALPDEERTT